MRKLTAVIVVLVLTVSVVFAANGKTASADANGAAKNFAGQKIVIAGTGDSQELLRIIAGVLEKKTGGKIAVPDSIGSGGGIKSVAEGKIDLARVARELNDGEKNLGLTYLLFAKSPVVFAVNPSVKGIDNITTEQIVRIYSGKITDWNDIGLSPGKIYAVTRESGDSSIAVVNASIAGFAGISAPAAKTIYTTPQVVAALAEHHGTIGFVPLPTTINVELKVLKIDGVEPSAENILNGSYKCVTPFAIVYKEQPKGLAKEFVDFLFSPEGQKIITTSGATPISK